jgi:hypothetical protein
LSGTTFETLRRWRHGNAIFGYEHRGFEPNRRRWRSQPQ